MSKIIKELERVKLELEKIEPSWYEHFLSNIGQYSTAFIVWLGEISSFPDEQNFEEVYRNGLKYANKILDYLKSNTWFNPKDKDPIEYIFRIWSDLKPTLEKEHEEVYLLLNSFISDCINYSKEVAKDSDKRFSELIKKKKELVKRYINEELVPFLTSLGYNYEKSDEDISIISLAHDFPNRYSFKRDNSFLQIINGWVYFPDTRFKGEIEKLAEKLGIKNSIVNIINFDYYLQVYKELGRKDLPIDRRDLVLSEAIKNKLLTS